MTELKNYFIPLQTRLFLYAFLCIMKVPEQVKNEARELIEQYGDSFDYLGNYEGADYFVYKFPEDATTGFPFVFRYGDGPVMTISGFDALDLINLLVEDVEEVDVE